MVGYPPFRGKPIKVIFEKIVSCDYSFNGLEWNSKSAESKDFISKLLLLDPYSRSTAEQCLSHPWINVFSTLFFFSCFLKRNFFKTLEME